MALLRKIFDRNPHWRRNNNPYVEPTDADGDFLFDVDSKLAKKYGKVIGINK